MKAGAAESQMTLPRVYVLIDGVDVELPSWQACRAVCAGERYAKGRSDDLRYAAVPWRADRIA